MTRRRENDGWIADANHHGMVVATQLVDTHGEGAALRWFTEHEQEPFHQQRDCMIVLPPAPED